MAIKILLLMILCHILDDFVLQPICLSNLKQKSWWEKNAPDKMYKNDYLVALGIHALSWSIMIHLPILFLLAYNPIALAISAFVNFYFHFVVDDLKANRHEFNLAQDQFFHFMQIIITFLYFI